MAARVHLPDPETKRPLCGATYGTTSGQYQVWQAGAPGWSLDDLAALPETCRRCAAALDQRKAGAQ